MDLSTAQDIRYGSTSVSAVYLGNQKIWPTSHDYSLDYLTLTALGSGNVTIQIIDHTESSTFTTAIDYSTDGTNWTTATVTYGTSVTIPVANNDKLYFKGNRNYYKVQTLAYDHLNITADVNHIISGNIMSLFYNTNFAGQTVIPSGSQGQLTHNLYGLFAENTYLSDASNLIIPATTLTEGCYMSMFGGCTSLTVAPNLPATTLGYNYGCYQGMFKGCSSLETAPYLPASSLVANCYESMFEDCTSLNYVKARFTTEPSNTYTRDWLSNVSSTGTFVKSQFANWTNVGTNAVPTGWTIETF